MTHTPRLFLLLTACLLLGLVGCSRTWVNIPAQRGDAAAHNPNASNVRQVLIQSLQAVLDDRQLDKPVLIRLPEHTSALTYAAVVPKVSPDAVSPYDLDDSHEQASPGSMVRVQAVRVRGWQGQVDITRPYESEGTMRQLLTVRMDYAPFSGWTVAQVQRYQGNAEMFQ